MQLSELLGASYKEGMTLEDVTEALKGIEMPSDQSAEIDRLKNSLTKSNSDAAEWKRKFRETQDEATRKSEEDAENFKTMQAELEKLRREQTVSGYKASYVSMGYAEEDAKKIAEALTDGKIDEGLAAQKKHQETLTEQIKKDLLKKTLRPDGSHDDKGDDDDDEGVRLVKELAKKRAGSQQSASDVMKHYM